MIYPYKVIRIAQWAGHLTDRSGDRWLYGMTCVGAKWPEMLGQVKFWMNRMRGKQTKIIEHKSAAAGVVGENAMPESRAS